MLLTALLVVLALSCDSQQTTPDAKDTALEANELSTASKTGPPMTATMQVGRNEHGSAFFPPGEHDASFHAKDAIQPGTVVISAGGTVTFNLAMFHTVAIYEDGTRPEDIDITALEDAGLPFEFPPVINDPEGRLGRSPLAFPAPNVFEYTFEEPGVYLVMCEVLPHFTVAKMYGYVRVK